MVLAVCLPICLSVCVCFHLLLHCRWLDEGEDDGKIVREVKVQDEYMDDILSKRNVSCCWQCTFQEICSLK